MVERRYSAVLGALLFCPDDSCLSLDPRKPPAQCATVSRSEEHTSELQSRLHLVCRLLLEKKKTINIPRLMRVKRDNSVARSDPPTLPTDEIAASATSVLGFA